jgi:hypothetical protein
MSIIYSYIESDGPTEDQFTAMVAVDPLTGAIRSGWTGGVVLADGTPCSSPVAANLLGGPELELAWNNCPPGLSTQAEPEYQTGLLDADGGAISDGNNWPLRFPGPVGGSPLVADLDGDGDLEYVVQAGGWYSRIHVYDLASPAAPGSVAWGEYGHDARKSGNHHGGLRIVSPNTVQPALAGPSNDPAPVSVTVKFSRGVPPQSIDPARWEVSIGGQVATISMVTVAGGVHTLLLESLSPPAAGAYVLRVEYDDGGIRSWDAYRDAVSYCTDDDRDGYCASVDCDDGNSTRFPGNPELCDGWDNDCDGGLPVAEWDADGDGIPGCLDCNDLDPFLGEKNDGQDNSCPGTCGYGVSDEVGCGLEFRKADDTTELSFPFQPGAEGYQIVRADSPGFEGPCMHEQWMDAAPVFQFYRDPQEPALGDVLYYLARPTEPFCGSWGQDSTGQDRVWVCPEVACD